MWLLIFAYPTGDCFTEGSKNPYPTLSNVFWKQISVRNCQMPLPAPHNWHDFLRCPQLVHTLATILGVGTFTQIILGIEPEKLITQGSDGIVLENQITFLQGKVSKSFNHFFSACPFKTFKVYWT